MKATDTLTPAQRRAVDACRRQYAAALAQPHTYSPALAGYGFGRRTPRASFRAAAAAGALIVRDGDLGPEYVWAGADPAELARTDAARRAYYREHWGAR